MNWFYDTFLPSLLERAGTNKGMWLSRKQTAICIEKMEKHTTIPGIQVPDGKRRGVNDVSGLAKSWPAFFM